MLEKHTPVNKGCYYPINEAANTYYVEIAKIEIISKTFAQ